MGNFSEFLAPRCDPIIHITGSIHAHAPLRAESKDDVRNSENLPFFKMKRLILYLRVASTDDLGFRV
jgi:hypothetical protein